MLENDVGELVVAMAGYSKEMDALFALNAGLPSRVDKTILFSDYNEAELLHLLGSSMKKKGHHAIGGPEGLVCKMVSKRLARLAGRVGFGNARQVNSWVDKMIDRQSSRLTREGSVVSAPSDRFLLTEADVLGPDPCNVSVETCPALRKLHGMIGLTSIKAQVDALVQMVKDNFQLEKRLKPLQEVALNRLFLGNPGQ